MKLLAALIFFFVFLGASSSWAKDVVRYNLSIKYPDPKQQYYVDVLELALKSSTDEFGDYELKDVSVEMPQGRSSILVELDQGLDITWRMTTAELEQRLQPIPIPLLKGLMGYRIGIIRKGEQENFPKNISKQQLQQVIIGQGHDWPDTIILRKNGMTVIEGLGHTLLTMLERKRFDLFLRAVHEPWLEIENKPNLIVEQNILVQYPAPMFFFVNRHNKRLHQRLIHGLNKAIDDGSFQMMFEEHPVTVNMIKDAKLEQRKVFKLFNPLLSVETQKLLEDKRLWY